MLTPHHAFTQLQKATQATFFFPKPFSHMDSILFIHWQLNILVSYVNYPPDAFYNILWQKSDTVASSNIYVLPE